MPRAEPGLQCSLLAVCTQRGASSSSVPNEPHLLTRNRPNLFLAFQGSLRAISSNNAHSLSLPNRICMDPGPPQRGPTQIVYTFHAPRSFLPIHLQPGLVLPSSLAKCLGPACSLQVFRLLMNPPPPPPLHLFHHSYSLYCALW